MKKSITLVLLLFCLLFIAFRFKESVKPLKQYIYSCRSESEGFSDIQKLYSNDTANAAKPFFSSNTLEHHKFMLSCTVRKTVLQQKKSGRLVMFRLQDPLVNLYNNGQPISAVTGDELTLPFFAFENNTGQITDIRIDSSTTPVSASILKNIISQFQFAKPVTNKAQWYATEENISGTYRAIYNFEKDSLHNKFYSKRNNGYLAVTGSLKNQRLIPESKTEYRVDSSGIVRDIHFSEMQVSLYGNDTLSLSGTSTSISLVTAENLPGDDVTALPALYYQPAYHEASSLSSGMSEQKITELSYKATLGTDNWESLLAFLNKQLTEKEMESLVLKFRALAYLEPEYCDKISAVLKTEPFGSYRYNILLQALSSATTEYATDAIVSFLKERIGEEELVIDLLPFFATNKAPTKKALSLLKEIAFSDGYSDAVSSTAQLALAGSIHSLRKINPQKADELTSYLVKKMEPVSDTLQKILVFGNTGSPAVLSYLKNIIANPGTNQVVKAKAIFAIRFITDNTATELLNQLYSSKDTLLSKTAKDVIIFRNEYEDESRP